ncbi:MAG: serine protease [Treponema sp.]|nr:serine protease [Treponema sp.]
MFRYSVVFLVILVMPTNIFAQQGASVVRDYVGLINQSYHPSIVSYFEKLKDELAKQGQTAAVRNLDIFLSGAFGSGFLYTDANRNFYVITNNHVVAQAYSLSITFERTDGTKTIIDNLKIIATDVENDLAILALPNDARPLVNQGLAFLTRQIEEGEEVFSAGFPGLGITPIWQFGSGRVSNANVRFPRSLTDETLLGPFIQHTAQVDSGNSGGPLLVSQTNVPSGFAVAGINTLTGVRRQAANYSIPLNTVRPFIENALNPRPETFRTALDERLAGFLEGINGKTSVYQHVAEFLSAVCIGENAEYAFEEMLKNAGRDVIRSFFQKGEDSVVGAMSIAIAWTIENSLRTRGVINASIKEVTGGGEEYNVVFSINNRDVNSIWIREYGNWRIKTFGTVAVGDQSLITRRQERRDIEARMRDSIFRIEAGGASLFKKAPFALYSSINFNRLGFNLYYVDSDFWCVGGYYSNYYPFVIGSIGFMPYSRFGIAYSKDKEYEIIKEEEWKDLGGPLPVSFILQFGLNVTPFKVPGLFTGVGFQYNLINLHVFASDDFKNPMKGGLSFMIGYSL